MPTVPIEDLLRLVSEENASDLHLTAGVPPTIRIDGRLVKLELPPLSPEEIEALARTAAGEEWVARAAREGGADFALQAANGDRFRASLFRQRETFAMALRLIPSRVMSLEEIGLPRVVHDLLDLPRGLVLVTGPTGSGKTTTLASMLSVIAASQRSHIVTVEDPIEYHLGHGQGIVNQREVGRDVPSFAEGLRRALRQDPDVIFVGEMRDLETMEIAMTAAETGHLVFSTVHTTGAARTVDRIIDAFPPEHQGQIRVQLAGNLKAAISQLLLPRADGKGRVAAFEVMVNTPSVAALIRDSKSYRIPGEIQTGSKFGMVSLEASLAALHERGLITREEVLGKAQDPDLAQQLLG
jgi:twitching motility protein PilT